MKNFSIPIVYGIHPIYEVIKARRRRILKVFVLKSIPKNVISILNIIDKNIPIFYYTKQQLDNICNSNEHQGIVIETTNFPYEKYNFDVKKYPLIVLFDKIQDPRNLGALLRSCFCTNIKCVAITTESSTPLTSSAFKASAGLAESLNIKLYQSAFMAAKEIAGMGYSLYLSDTDGTEIQNIEPKEKSCIVIGNEGDGITSSLYSLGDKISISQSRKDISYNASVAGGIIMYNFAIKMKLI
jgi:23S rRNA (guanosine2251-2'-O)-methyltransferase